MKKLTIFKFEQTNEATFRDMVAKRMQRVAPSLSVRTVVKAGG